ncbi:MAG: hypothetical protein GY725_01120 [bacterium]|nr:hypothetical protein [bacterium]
MNDDLIRRNYGYGAGRIRLSVPSHCNSQDYSFLDAWRLTLQEARDLGIRVFLFHASRNVAVCCLILVILSTPFLWSFSRPSPEVFEPLVIQLIKPEPPPLLVEPDPVEPDPVPLARPLVTELAQKSEPEPVAKPRRSPQVSIDALAPVAARSPRPDIEPLPSSRNAPLVYARAPISVGKRVAVPDVAAAAPRLALPSAPVVSRAVPSDHVSGHRRPSLPARPALAPFEASAKAQDNGISGVPLASLAACETDAEEDSLKQDLIFAVDVRESCRSVMGVYRFLQMRNVNGFLLWVSRSPDRPELDRCGELRLALSCLEGGTEAD